MGRKIACFTEEQQKAYDNLSPRHQLYVDYRGVGYTKAEAYRSAGYSNKNAKMSAYLLERTNQTVKTLVDVLQKRNMAANALAMESGEINFKRRDDADADRDHQTTALATQQDAEKILQTLQNADVNTADRVKFYRDIVNGKIKTTRETIVYDSAGVQKQRKIEIVDDVTQRINARKELDKILGIGTLAEMGHISAGQITINIVDASKASVEKKMVEEQEAILEPDAVVVEKDKETESDADD